MDRAGLLVLRCHINKSQKGRVTCGSALSERNICLMLFPPQQQLLHETVWNLRGFESEIPNWRKGGHTHSMQQADGRKYDSNFAFPEQHLAGQSCANLKTVRCTCNCPSFLTVVLYVQSTLHFSRNWTFLRLIPCSETAPRSQQMVIVVPY